MINVLMAGPDRSVHGGISGVVNGYYDAGLDKKINLRYIGTMREGSRARKLIVAAGAYVKFLRALGWADIVHIHVASDSSFIRKSLFVRAAHRHHKKIVIHQHGGDFVNWYSSMSEGKRASVAATLKMADLMLVLSPSWKEFFEKTVGVEKTEVLPNSIKIPPEERLRSTVKKPHSILFLGRICVTKGIRELMECVPALAEKFPDTEILLGGIWEDGSLRPLVEKYPENVKYIGWVSGETKEKYLEESAVYVLPTYFEGQPVSVLEAMAAECTVVASRVGGIPMMIEDGTDGFLVKEKDTGELAEALLKVLSDAELRKKVGKKAREKVIGEYDIENSIRRLTGIYERIYSGKE